jgi:hypothetical protein
MTAHDLTAPAGTACPGCGPDAYDLSRPPAPYWIVAARNTAAAIAACGHDHAEHIAHTYDEAEELTEALAQIHAGVDMMRLADDGRYHTVRGIVGSEGRVSGGCCQPALGTYRTPEHPTGELCRYCGDPMARWTHAA